VERRGDADGSEILPLQALDMAAWDAKREGAVDLTGLVHHADHGSNYTRDGLHRPRIGELGAEALDRDRRGLLR
jgi:putative transposase